MSGAAGRRLRADLPFRRLALVLSGGGALGAYEAGVLRVLGALGVTPSLVAGVSVGAVNAVVWLSQGRTADGLDRTWRRIDNSTLGLRWTTLYVRALGAFLTTLAVFEVFLTILGSDQLGLLRRLLWPGGRAPDLPSVLLDALMWLLVGAVGIWLIRLSRRVEHVLARGASSSDPHRTHRWFTRALVIGAIVHLVAWSLALPWPHRFSATVLAAGTLLWLGNRPGPGGDRLRSLFARVLPETGGRGLWGNESRRRLVRELIDDGDPSRLLDTRTRLVIGALALDTGRVAQFVAGTPVTAEFRERIEHALGEVIELRSVGEIVEATVASSALPGIFEPVDFGGRTFVDAGGFSNQPLHVAMADDSDAIIVVALSPTSTTRRGRDMQLFELGGRLLEIANWRDMAAERSTLPEEWNAPAIGGTPARLCMIEPDAPMEGTLLHFAPELAGELIRRGEQDAWRGLETAGWLETPAGGATRDPAARL